MDTLKRILLVEDDPRDVELTLTGLQEHHRANQIAIARDGAEALDYLLRQGSFADRPVGDPVVVLLDVKMPRVDGIEVLRRIKSDEHLRTIPVVMLTSSREARDLEECYRLGANAYVVKPVHFSEFVESARSVGVFWALINEPPLGSAGKVA
jgi:CheY-like chemotaxis protein